MGFVHMMADENGVEKQLERKHFFLDNRFIKGK